MISSFFRRLTLLWVALMFSSALANAQTTGGSRPGSAARSTVSSGNRSTSSSSSSSSSRGSGPHQYRSNTELGDATIQIDPETRSLVIVTDEDTHRELVKVIRQLDKPKPQVLIKVVFLEVTYNKDLDVGVEGAYNFNLANGKVATTGNRTTTSTINGTTANGAGTTTTTQTNTTPLDSAAKIGTSLGLSNTLGLAAATTGSFVRLTSDDWSATVHLLASKGKLEVLSRPSIMARNNQEAVIVVGSEVPFITNSRITDTGETINTIQYDNVGIILRVTPFITSEGSVEMIVAPEISTLTDQTVPISNNASAPVIAKRSAETVVVTPNAQTVVIGGLMETQHTETITKIPLLGDIPYLGAAFRHTVKADVKKELLMFLTPYIVDDAKGLREVTNDEVDKTDLVEKAFKRKDFEKYLDSLPMPGDEPSLVPPEVRKATFVKPAPAVKKKGN